MLVKKGNPTILALLNFSISSEIELTEITKSEKSYFANYFKDCSNNIKKIRSIITRIFDNGKDIAEKVNDFFVNIGPDTEIEIPKVPNISPS